MFKIHKPWSLFHCEHVLKFVETSAYHVDMFYCDKTKCKRQDEDEVALGKVSKGKVFRIFVKKMGVCKFRKEGVELDRALLR